MFLHSRQPRVLRLKSDGKKLARRLQVHNLNLIHQSQAALRSCDPSMAGKDVHTDVDRGGIPSGSSPRWAAVQSSHGSFSCVAAHEMGLPRKAKKEGPRDPVEESLEEVFFAYFESFWPC